MPKGLILFQQAMMVIVVTTLMLVNPSQIPVSRFHNEIEHLSHACWLYKVLQICATLVKQLNIVQSNPYTHLMLG